MRYAVIHSAIWNDEKVKLLDQDSKFLLLYLITCPHGNMVGLFTLKNGYACEDLGWSAIRYAKSLQKLVDSGFIEVDEEQSVVLIRKQLKIDPVEENSNNVAGAMTQISRVPATHLKQHLLEILEENEEWGNRLFTKFLADFIRRNNAVDTALGRRKNDDRTTVAVAVTDSVTENISVGQNKPCPTDGAKFDGKKLKAQAIEVLNFFNQKTGKSFRPVDATLDPIICRLKSGVTVSDCKQVIANRCIAWETNPDMKKYLQISTVFRVSKFEEYFAIVRGNREKIARGEDI